MRKLSLDHVFGCSTSHRHSLIALPNDRFAFIAGCYLVIFDASSHEQRYLPFSAIEFLYISPRGTIMALIDRMNPDSDSKIHLFSTQPIESLSIIEPDRFGTFVSITMNQDETILLILHGEPGYMLTLQGMQLDVDDEQTLMMVDLASVRLVQGPVFNRMTKEEVTPHVAFVSFCPSASDRFCVTGVAIFKLFQIEGENLHPQLIHFRAEFYSFTCHCWIDPNSILVATNHGHIFYIHEGSIRSDVSLEESLTCDLNISQETSSVQPLVNDLIRYPTIEPVKSLIYVDLISSNELSPYVIVSFQEHLLVFIPIENEPFVRVISRSRLVQHHEQQTDVDVHFIHKMSYIFDRQRSWIYLLTDRNQIFRCHIQYSASQIQLVEEFMYGCHAHSVASIGFCAYKPWLITLDEDHSIRLFDYKDRYHEIIRKSIPDAPHLISNFDPFGFHLCSATNNRFQLYSMTNHELRLIHQYETRNIRQLVISEGGHLVAIVSNNLIKIYSTIHFKLISQLRGHVGKIQQVIWCKNDAMMISCSADGMIYTFNSLTGTRENEIITKQFRYVGIATTNDARRIYAITTDSSIKIFNNTTLEDEWPIENHYLPSAITLSRSERLLYVGMSHGLIRLYPIPFLSETYIDLAAHSSSIRRLIVSHDDQYVASIGESAYVLLFRQTTGLIQSMSSHYEFPPVNVEPIETNRGEETIGIPKHFDFILITKSDFDEQQKKIEETQARINEFETENNLKLQGKRLAFSQQLNSYSTKFETMMKELLQTREEIKTNLMKMQCQFENEKEEVEDHYIDVKTNLETIYERKMIDTLSRIEHVQLELQRMKNDNEKKSTMKNIDEEKELIDLVDRINGKLQNQWQIEHDQMENLRTKEREMKEFIRQNELDFDDEIEQTKRFYDEQLMKFTDYVQQLTIDVSTLRKQYNSILHRIESRDHQRSLIEKELKDFEIHRINLIDQLENSQLMIQKKEDRIGNYDMKLHRLQQQILQIEKRKYVLDYKTKSLMEQIEPIDQDIRRLKTNNGQLEQQLTHLKQQQMAMQQREKLYQNQFVESTKKLVEAKKLRQQLENILREYQNTIRKAYDSMVIGCSSSDKRPEQWKIQLKKISHQLQNEQQSEDQLEIEGFINEWNRQRRWLLTDLNRLTQLAEEQKQQIAQNQREHRKNLAPYINQLRDLQQLQNEIEKKIQKRFVLLKIKPNEQNDFIRQMTEILHGDQQRHLIVENLRQTEIVLESRERELQRLADLIVRDQIRLSDRLDADDLYSNEKSDE